MVPASTRSPIRGLWSPRPGTFDPSARPADLVNLTVTFGDFAPYIEATALGLLVGLERSWATRVSEQQDAGVRTFAVLALAGAAASASGQTAVAAGAIAVALLLAVGYVKTAQADLGITTEVAAVATYFLGALVAAHATLAVGAAVMMATVLALKGPIHRFSREIISAVEVTDALRFLVAAFVLLPLVPDRALGPYGALNPFKIWLLVVILTGIGWAGYIAVRALGSRRALPITGFAGGFVSATATSASLARIAKTRGDVDAPALSGIVLASAATLIQLSLVLSVANRSLLRQLATPVVVGVALLAAEAGLLLWRGRHAPSGHVQAPSTADAPAQTRPLRLGPALVLAALLTAVTVLARWASAVVGSGGAIGATALAGFADAHAPSLAVATLAATGGVSAHTALAAIGCALATNTITKIVLTAVAGGWRFSLRFAATMALPVAGTAAALALALV